MLVNLGEAELNRADAAARSLGVSRSEVIRRAVATFASQAGTTTEDGPHRRRRALQAFARMRAIGRKIQLADPTWDPMAIIRRDRERRGW